MAERLNRWVGLLRGINLGKRQVKMAALKDAMQACGYANITTIIASGNVIFDSPHPAEADAESRRVSACLQAAFGFAIDVILRTPDQMRALAAAAPFAGVEVTPETRLYVSFLPGEPQWREKLPFEFAGGRGRILSVAGGNVCTVIQVGPNFSTPDAMNGLDLGFGKHVTMRNWNTVEKIVRKLDEYREA